MARSSDSRRTDVDAARSWRAPQLNVSVVGLIVVVSSVFYASEASNDQPRGIAADQAFQERSVAGDNGSASDERIEKPLQAAESDRSPTTTPQKQRTDDGGIGSESTSGADSNDQAVARPVGEQPVLKIFSETEFRADGAAGERMPIAAATRAPTEEPSKAMAEEPSKATAEEPSKVTAEEPSKATAEEPSRPDVLSPPPLAAKTGSSIERSHDPVVPQIGRVISGVNMRAGPSNEQPVLATIPRGSSVEVVGCRHWCEVNFGGQRGWVYKTFIQAPLADVAKSRMPTKSKPRKAHRLKPAPARLSAARNARDARDRSGSSGSGPSFLGAIGYLLQQISPTALWPNSD
jgi:hypothetical protein